MHSCALEITDDDVGAVGAAAVAPIAALSPEAANQSGPGTAGALKGRIGGVFHFIGRHQRA